jgi:very-short-patch-repair endonuclease
MFRKTRGKTSVEIVKAVREQRRQSTPAEQKLWQALRGRRLAGLKFRRQHAIGRFILDLFCVEHQLAVEVGDGIHTAPRRTEYDAARSKFLEERGLRVLRFWNEEVEKNLDHVLNKIVEACFSPPVPLSRGTVQGE